MLRRVLALSLLMAGVFSAAAAAQDLMTEKKTFELPSYTTAGGSTIKNVKSAGRATARSTPTSPTPS